MPADSFTLPQKDKDRVWPSDEVCVVGLIGKNGASGADKSSLFNLALERQVFSVQHFGESSFLQKVRNLSGIEPSKVEQDEDVSFSGFYDAEQQTIFIQLVSMHDIAQLARICQRTQKSLSHSALHDVWRAREHAYCSALLLLFCTCHIIMISHPSEQFDPTYVHLFESLAAIRDMLESSITSYLGDTLGRDVPHLWLQSGRCALPRLLFVMHQTTSYQWLSDPRLYPLEPFSRDHSSQDSVSRVSDTWVQRQTSRYGVAAPAKRFQLFLEDQVYNIFKNCPEPLISGSNALFALNSRKFIHVVTSATASPGLSSTPSLDTMSILMRSLAGQTKKLRHHIGGKATVGSPASDHRSAPSSSYRPSSPVASSSGSTSGAAVNRQASTVHPVPLPARYAERSSDDITQRLQSFLLRHVEAIHQSTDTNVFDPVALGENDSQLPACSDWFAVASALHDFFLGPKGICDSEDFGGVMLPMDLQRRFSESRCSKGLPLAMKAYKDNLPSLYMESRHKLQLSNALKVFSLHGRGPSTQMYKEQIKQQCDQYWRDGHQACEQVSLTGHACQLPLHLILLGNESETATASSPVELARKPHSNNHSATHACNCGQKQGVRNDPFTLKDANFSFYENLERDCCVKLVRAIFPCQPMIYGGQVGEFCLPVPCSNPSDLTTRRQHLQARQAVVTMLTVDEPSLHASLGDKLSNPEEASRGLRVASASRSSSDSIGISDHEAAAADEPRRHMPFVEQTAIDIVEDESDSFAGTSAFEAGGAGQELVSSASDTNLMPSTEDTASVGLNADEEEDTSAMPISDSLTAWPLYSAAIGGTAGEAEVAPLNDGVRVYDQDEEEDDVETLRPFPTSLSHGSMEASDGHIMLHTGTVDGAVPAFPSWSVTSLGHANLYNSATGLPQPGFLQGSNFLLAWDVPINAVQSGTLCMSTVADWTAMLDTVHRNRVSRGSRSAKGASDVPTEIRLFVGLEYECYFGSRFLAAGPNKASKIFPTGHLKDSAYRILSPPMPLYMSCPCRSAGKAHTAQLMRFFITTPPEGIEIVLHPSVQPAPSPCPIFQPGMAGGIVLPPSSFCVLRFPYIYADDTGAILLPADQNPDVFSCRLLEGLIELR